MRDGKKNRHEGLKTSNHAIYLEAEWEDDVLDRNMLSNSVGGTQWGGTATRSFVVIKAVKIKLK